MKTIATISFILATIIVSQAGFAHYEKAAVELLSKVASDANFYKRNADKISALVPPIRDDLRAYLNKNSKTLSTISRSLGPKIQRCNGDYKALSRQAQMLCAPLLLSDGAGTQKLMKNGKKALGSVNSQQLAQECMRVIPTLR